MASGAHGTEDTHMPDTSGRCPECRDGDLITISMTVSERDLTFITCHSCQAKWWQRDGQPVPLASVIDAVVKK
jgi:DNA polymerase III alpha subunit (gram-positive type)